MKVLIAGGGGREHSLAWKIAQSRDVDEVLSLPGNPGVARYGRRIPGSAEDASSVVAAAREHKVDLVVIGPEAPLVAGVGDALRDAGIPCFGPSSKAAQLEGSKIFAKGLMRRAGVPTADFAAFDEPGPALAYVRGQSPPWVIKADGLAAGKGVRVCETIQEAEEALHRFMVLGELNGAGARVVIEEKLEGQEASVLALCDGERFLSLEAAQDHKRVWDKDRGPNTGGMGAYSPTPVVSETVKDRIDREILAPTLATMAREGMPFRGVLYAGVMVQEGLPRVLEYNVRFGDPETQAILPRMQSDLVPFLRACAEGSLQGLQVRWSDEAAMCVVLCSEGYPGPIVKGKEIRGLSKAEIVPHAVVFQAGTELRDGVLITHGGRVLGVTGMDKTLFGARAAAYEAAACIEWDGLFYRTDIGWQALTARAEGAM